MYISQCYSWQGCGVALCCCGCLLCPDPVVTHLRGPETCKFGCIQGCGASLICVAKYSCIPNWLQDYSNWLSVKDRLNNGREKIYNLRIQPDAISERDNGKAPSNRELN